MNKLVSLGGVESFIDSYNSRHYTRVAEFERPFRSYKRKSVHVLLSYAPDNETGMAECIEMLEAM